MFARVIWAILLALSCASTVAAQSTLYQFTMSVTSPAPVPGQPFTFTWTGGETTEAVYIALNYYFPEPTDQNIIEFSDDILSNAPNNGSWTYNVPGDLAAGRHSFSIGYNPVQLSETTDIFIILASETSETSSGYLVPGTTNTAFQSYNGCGLPPLPDYTYTGYQPPCTTTVSGHVETLYPIVPASDSSLWYTLTPPTPTSTAVSSTAPTINTAFATGVYAQALQCPTAVTPSTTKITVSGATTIFSLVGCNSASGSNTIEGGVCHPSGYTTFSVSGTSSVCCPDGWATTPLNTELFCFTSMTEGTVEKRQATTETLGENLSSTLVAISGVVFTSAGVVTGEAVGGTGSSTASTTSGKSVSTGIVTGATASASTTKSGALKLDLGIWGSWGLQGFLAVMGALYIFYN